MTRARAGVAVMLCTCISLLLAACGTGGPTQPAPTPSRPLIFVPGFMGSELAATADEEVTFTTADGASKTVTLRAGDVVWPHLNTRVNVFGWWNLVWDPDSYDVLMFDSSGQPLVRSIRPNGHLYTDFDGYGAVQPFFERNGYATHPADPTKQTLFLFGWDFRYPAAHQAKVLDAFVLSVIAQTGAERVDIVAHSQGTLVTRAFLTMPDMHRERVEHAILLGGPGLGSPHSLDVVVNGQCAKRIGNFCAAFPAHKVRYLVRTWPGAIEDVVSASYYQYFHDQDVFHPLPYVSPFGPEQLIPPDQFHYEFLKRVETNSGIPISVLNGAEAFRQSDLTWISLVLHETTARLTLAGGSGKCAMGQIRQLSGVFDYVKIDGDTVLPRQSVVLGDGFRAEFAQNVEQSERLFVYVRHLEHGQLVDDHGLGDVLKRLRDEQIQSDDIQPTCSEVVP